MHCFYRKTSLWRKFPISSSALYLYIFSKLASQFMFSISRCEAADVSSPVEMAVEVVNGNIFYNSPLQETIRIHLHYHLNINYSQPAQSVLTFSPAQVPWDSKQWQMLVTQHAALSSSIRCSISRHDGPTQPGAFEEAHQTEDQRARQSSSMQLMSSNYKLILDLSLSNTSHFERDNVNVNGFNIKEYQKRNYYFSNQSKLLLI